MKSFTPVFLRCTAILSMIFLWNNVHSQLCNVQNQVLSPLNNSICPGDSAWVNLANTEPNTYYVLFNDTNYMVDGIFSTVGGPDSISTWPLYNNDNFGVRAYQLGGAISFDGVDDYVQALTPLDLSTGDNMTMEVWIKPTDVSSELMKVILAQDVAGDTDFMLNFNNNGTTLEFYLKLGPTGFVLQVPIVAANYTDGQWHHLAAVYDGVNMTLYSDTVQIGQMPANGLIQYTDTSRLDVAMAFPFMASGLRYAGDMDELRIWKTARSLQDIKDFMFIGIDGAAPGLMLNYRFDEMPVTFLAPENSGSGNSGVLNNMSGSEWTLGINYSCVLPMNDTVSVTLMDDYVSFFTDICNGDSLLVGGSYQTTTGVYFDTLTNIFNCDSIIETNLFVQPVYQDTLRVIGCMGDSVNVAGSWYWDAGFYSDSSSTVMGCDSVTVTEFVVYPEYTVVDLDLYFSEYIEGSSNNKAIEIFNPKQWAVDLSDYQVKLFNNGSITPSNTLTLTGTLASGDVFVMAHGSSDPAILAIADVTSNVTLFNGDDALLLTRVSTGDTIDVFGRIGEDPGTMWSSASNQTQDVTLVRANWVLDGVMSNPAAGFPTLEAEWISYAIDEFSYLGSHTGMIENVTFDTAYVCSNDSVYVGGVWTNVAGTYYDTLKIPHGENCVLNYWDQADMYYIDPMDSSGFIRDFVDNDGLTPNAFLAGFSSNWMTFYEEVSPGDTNYFYGATSWFDSPGMADNWIIIGDVSVPSWGVNVSWNSMVFDNSFRDGYSVVVNTVGPTVTDFMNNGTVIWSAVDNDPMTDGDTLWGYYEAELDGGTYGGQQVYIAIWHNAFDMFILGIDNFEVANCQQLIECDSVILTEVMVYPSFFSSWDTTICQGDQVWAGGAWQSMPGSYYDTLMTIDMCDSVIETNLSVYNDVWVDIWNNNYNLCQGDTAWVTFDVSGGPILDSVEIIINHDGNNLPSFWVYNIGTYAFPTTNPGNYWVNNVYQGNCWYNGNGNADVELDYVSPQNLGYSTDISCPGGNINFSFYSNNLNVYDLYWSMGDGYEEWINPWNFNYSYPDTGMYDVWLHVETDCGWDSTMLSVWVTDSAAVDASFGVTANPVCPNTSLDFSPANWGYQNYDWDFGDGGNSNDVGPSYSYSSAGDYIVTLTVSDVCGSSTWSDTISIDSTLGPQWSWIDSWNSNTSICPNDSVWFSYSAWDWNNNWMQLTDSWDLDDGNFMTGDNIGHAWADTGTYFVELTLTDNCLNDTILITQVNVTDVFKADPTITAANFVGCPGDPMYFWNANDDAYYVWDFGDGSMDSSGYSVNHAYADTGSYDVILYAYNNCGMSSDTVTVNIMDGLGMTLNLAGIYTDPDSICPGTPLYMYYYAYDQNWLWKSFDSVVWDMGDGNIIMDSLYLDYTYSDTGLYTISVYMMDGCGNDTTVSTNVYIGNPNFQAQGIDFYYGDDSYGCPLENFWASYYAYDNNWNQIILPSVWDFGDGNFEYDEQIVSFNYNALGDYNLQLTLTDACYNDTVISQMFNVVDTVMPVAGVYLSNNVICPGTNVEGWLNWDDNVDDVQWIWGDGSDSWGWNENHTYDDTGVFVVQVNLFNNCTTNTIYDTVVVNGSMNIMASYVDLDIWPNTVCPEQSVNMDIDSDWGFNSSFWDFGDGITASVNTPYVQYTYSNVGTYQVNVTLTDGCGNDTTISNTVDVDTTLGAPNANWWANTYVNCPGDMISFWPSDNNQNDYLWDFGDGNTSTDSEPDYAYMNPGSYEVTLTIGNGCGYSSWSDSVWVDTTVTKDINFITIQYWPDESEACPGDWMYFGYAAMDQWWNNIEFSTVNWDFGDGTQDSGQSVLHIFPDTGWYAITLNVADGCGNDTSIVDSLYLDGMTPAVIGNDVGAVISADTICPGDSVTFFTWGMLNGFSWSFGDGDSSSIGTEQDTGFFTFGHTYLSAGSFDAILYYTNGCGNSVVVDTFGVYVDTASVPQVQLFIDNTNNLNTCDSVEIVGLGANTYDFDFGDGTGSTNQWNDHLYDLPGTYNVSVVGYNSCGNSDSISVPININPGLYVMARAKLNVSCSGANDGYAEVVMVGGGSGNYSYLWNNGETISSISALGPGTYYVDISDNDIGCAGSDTFLITEPAILMGNLTAFDALCYGGSDGFLNLAVSGGSGLYSFAWSNGSTAQNLMAGAGTYTVTITDSKNCQATASGSIGEPTPINVIDAVTDASCNGMSNGLINLTVSGGAGSYSYNWSSGESTSSINNLASGYYDVTVTDINTCIVEVDSIYVDQPSALSDSISTTDESCGSADGTATILATGGTTPYGYNWNTGAINATATGLSAGMYYVTVTDLFGCTIEDSVTVSGTPDVVLSIIKVEAFCGSDTATATANVSVGQSPFTYAWSNGETTSMVDSLPAGLITVTVTDANSCSSSSTVTLSNPDGPTLSSVSTDVLCNGDTTGAVDLTITGGTSPFGIAWDNGDSTEDINGLGSGIYSVQVNDANGCIAALSDTINQPSILGLSAVVTNLSCNASGDGMIAATANGGSSPYTFIWNTGETTATISGLAQGSYGITTTDGNGCFRVDSFVVTEPTVIAISETITNVSCSGGNNGKISISVTGGTAPYTRLWSTGANALTISNLIAGSYSVTVTDFKGCTSIGTYNVTEPSSIVITGVTTDAPCNAGTGLIDLSVSGGVSPYTFSWSNGSTTEDVTPVAGAYSVTVTDNNGCSSVGSFSLSDPSALSTIVTSNDGLCGAMGNASVKASGGTTPYSYNWSNGGTTETIDSLVAGTYVVTVTDANGCTKVDSTTLITTPSVSVSVATTDAACGVSDGTATATVTGGTSAFTYSWSSGHTGTTADSLAAGAYSLTLTDANGCMDMAGFAIGNTGAPTVSISGTDVDCAGSSTGAADLTVTSTLPYTVSWSNGSTTEDISGVTAGSYDVTVTDSLGCQAVSLVSIGQPDSVAVTVNATDPTCNADTDGTISASVSGGVSPYSYMWQNGETGTSVSGLSSATLGITVTDANGCSAMSSGSVTPPAVVSASVSGVDPSCGASDGAVSVSASGGVGSFTYMWNSGSNLQTVTNVGAGNYSVTATDGNGCSASASTSLSNAGGASVTLIETNISCNGDSTGAIDATATGGTGTLSYAWSNFMTTEDITNLTAGTYSITVTDSLNCVTAVSATISEPAALVVAVSQTDASCNGTSDGTATASVSGGTSPFTYLWDDVATSVTASISSGVDSLMVIVTDANSCTVSGSTVINEPSAVLITVSSTDVTCNGDGDGTVDASASGGMSPYSYLWDDTNASTTFSVSGLDGNTYNVTVTDSTGCSGVAAATVTEPAVLSVTTSGTDPSCNGAMDGTADVTGAGGMTPYTFNWSSGGTGPSVSGLGDGTVSVTATDVNGCTVSGSQVITDPAAIVIAGVVDDSQETGSIDVTTTGGAGGFTYAWSSGETTEDLSGLTSQGSYTITATDLDGCSDSQTFTVAGIVTVGVLNGNTVSMSMYPNPARNMVTITIVGTETGVVEVYNAIGEVVDSFRLDSSGKSLTGLLNVSGMSQGVYFVKLQGSTVIQKLIVQ